MNPHIPHLKRHRAPQLYQLSCEKWSIHYASLSAMLNPLHSISNQELFKKHLYNPRIPKERNRAVRPNHINYHLKSELSITLRCRLCSTHYTAVRIKNCLKSTSEYQNHSHDEKYGRFPFRREAIMCSHQINTFPCQQRWMGHKGGHW